MPASNCKSKRIQDLSRRAPTCKLRIRLHNRRSTGCGNASRNGVPSQLVECAVQMPEVDKYTATRSGPGTIRDPLDTAHEDDDAFDEISDESSNENHTEHAAETSACSVEQPAPKTFDPQVNQFETPPGVDPTSSPSFVQHVTAFKAHLDAVHDAVKRMRSVEKSTDAGAEQPEDDSAPQAAAEEECFRAVVDLREAAKKLDKHKFEEKAKLLDAVDNKAMFVPGNKLMSMFDPSTWTQCYSEFWYGDALPNTSEGMQKP